MMPGRRLPLGLGLAEREPDENGDIWIGAFARRQVRRRWMFGAFGVSLIVFAGALYWGLGMDRGVETRTPPLPLRCAACGLDESRAMPAGPRFPIACPRCKQNSLRPLWVCRQCDERFLPALQSDAMRCPRCGSDQVGAVPPAPPPKAR